MEKKTNQFLFCLFRKTACYLYPVPPAQRRRGRRIRSVHPMRFSIGTGMYIHTEWPKFDFGAHEADWEELEGIELYDLEGGGESGRENKSVLG